MISYDRGGIKDLKQLEVEKQIKNIEKNSFLRRNKNKPKN